MNTVAVALDIGGTKVSAALVDSAGCLSCRVTQRTDRNGRDSLVGQVTSLARGVISGADRLLVGVGVSVAGVVDHETGTVDWAPNLLGWTNVPLARILSEAVGLPVTLAYDGHAGAVGEYRFGAGRGTHNMVFLVMGTGVGGGLILDGRLYRGSSNLAGAAGWMIADPDSANVAEARTRGNLESLASGTGLVRAARRLRSENAEASGSSPEGAADVLRAADEGDPVARAAVARAAEALGRSVASIVSLLNPDAVVLGGGLGMASLLFRDTARRFVRDSAQPVSARAVRIEQAQLGDDGFLAGAAQLVFETART